MSNPHQVRVLAEARFMLRCWEHQLTEEIPWGLANDEIDEEMMAPLVLVDQTIDYLDAFRPLRGAEGKTHYGKLLRLARRTYRAHPFNLAEYQPNEWN